MPTTKSKINDVILIYRQGGMVTLIYRVIGYFLMKFFSLYLTVRTRGVTERKICGHIMYLNLRDPGIPRTIALFGKHEPLVTRLLNQEIKPGMNVVDVGAHIGYYTLQMAHLVGESGEVIAIEPTPDNANLLKMNIEANGYRNVRIYEVAIGAENGTARLYISRNPGLCSLIPSDVHYSYVEVPLRTLDTLLEQEGKIDYIRMDIQGSEVEAIKGMQGILQKYGPALFIETHQWAVGGEALFQLFEDLKKLGYETKYVINYAFDHPIVKRSAMGTMSLDDLKMDKRVMDGRAKISLFLEAVGEPAS